MCDGNPQDVVREQTVVRKSTMFVDSENEYQHDPYSEYQYDSDGANMLANMHQDASSPDIDEDDEDEVVMQSRHRLHLAYRSEDQRYKDMAEKDVGYYFWAKNEKKPTVSLQNFIRWVEEHYIVDHTNMTLTNKEDGSILLRFHRARTQREPGIAETIETIEEISKAQATEATLQDVITPCQVCTHFAIGMTENNLDGNGQYPLVKTCQDLSLIHI